MRLGRGQNPAIVNRIYTVLYLYMDYDCVEYRNMSILFETASFSEVLLFLINYFDTKLLLLLVLHATGTDLNEASCSNHSYKCHLHRAILSY